MSIQIKRGMKKDLPQLKDGELAFCRDTKELYVGNNGNENVSVTKKVEDRLDAVDSQLVHNTNYLNGSENILNYVNYTYENSEGIIIWDEALKQAMKNNRAIYFPSGDYRFTCKNIILNEGNILYGDGILQSSITFDIDSDLPSKDTTTIYPPKAYDVEEGEFIFKYNNKSGLKDLTIYVKDDYHGDVLLLEPGSVVADRRYYILENVLIGFKYVSGYGNGLTIKLQNFDENGVFTDGRANSLSYFYVNNFEVAYGHKGLNVQAKQVGNVQNPVWMTATSFTKCRFNSCVYGIYFELINNGNKEFLDFHDIKFIDTEIQIQPQNTLSSTVQQGVGIYADGGGHPWRLGLDFTNLTVWDSPNRINGILKDSKIIVYGYFVSSKLTGEGYVQGIKVDNSLVSINEDVQSYRLTNKKNGNISEFSIIDGGFSFKDDPEGNNGYNARGALYELPMPSELNSTNGVSSYTMLENYNKNNSVDGYLEIGYGKGHNDTIAGRCNLMSKGNDGVIREVATFGNEGIYYNDSNSQQGFYAGNGMYIKEERTTVTVPAKDGYQDVFIPIKTNYTFVPFLISSNLQYTEPYNDSYLYDVFIRIAQVIKQSDGTKVVKIVLKHNKPSDITLRFQNILCGYLQYKNRIK